VNSVSCSPAGPSSRALSEFQGVRVGSARTVAPAARRRDLDVIDEGGVREIEQLERRAAGFQDGYATILGGECLALAQSEDVAVEDQRLVVVGRRDGYAKLSDMCGVGHERPSLSVASEGPLGRPGARSLLGEFKPNPGADVPAGQRLVTAGAGRGHAGRDAVRAVRR
jgi:hypothetical protein